MQARQKYGIFLPIMTAPPFIPVGRVFLDHIGEKDIIDYGDKHLKQSRALI